MGGMSGLGGLGGMAGFSVHTCRFDLVAVFMKKNFILKRIVFRRRELVTKYCNCFRSKKFHDGGITRVKHARRKRASPENENFEPCLSPKHAFCEHQKNISLARQLQFHTVVCSTIKKLSVAKLKGQKNHLLRRCLLTDLS